MGLGVTAAAQIHWRGMADAAAVRPINAAIVGAPVPPMELRPLADFGARPLARPSCVLYYFFEPDCPACAAGAPAWTGIEEIKGANGSVPVVWILMDREVRAATAFLDTYGIVAPALFSAHSSPHHELGVMGVPTVWGIVNDTLRYTATGVTATSPDEIPVTWCHAASG